MFPYPIISNTHVIPTSDIKKMESTQDVVYILYNNGNLYVMGSNQYGVYGQGKATTASGGGANATSTWTLSKTNVDDVWGGSACALIRLKTGEYQYCGLARITGQNNTSIGSLTWTNHTAINSFISANPTLSVKKIHIGAGQAVGLLMSNDALYMIGYSSQGGFGSGTQVLTSVTQVQTNVSDFCLGGILTMYISKTNGQLYRAGWNVSGQLGNGTTTSITTYTSTGVAATSIYCTGGATYYVDSTGRLFSSGEYGAGQRNNGITVASPASSVTFGTSYTQLTTGLPSGTSLVGNTSMYATTQAMVWYKINNDLYIIGQNLSGQQGNGTSGNSASFVKTVFPGTYNATTVLNYVQVGLQVGTTNTGNGGTGAGVGYMLMNDGTLWCCGDYRYYTGLTGHSTDQHSWVSLPKPE